MNDNSNRFFPINSYTPPSDEERNRLWFKCLEEYRSRNSKWFDDVTTIRWNTQKIHSMPTADYYDLCYVMKQIADSALQASSAINNITEIWKSSMSGETLYNSDSTLCKEIEVASDEEIAGLLKD